MRIDIKILIKPKIIKISNNIAFDKVGFVASKFPWLRILGSLRKFPYTKIEIAWNTMKYNPIDNKAKKNQIARIT